LLSVFVQRAIVALGHQRPQDRLARHIDPPRPPTAMRLGAAPALHAHLLAPQIYCRQPHAKTLRNRCRRQTGFISQQHPLAQVGRIGVWHRFLLREAANSTHKQDAF
jgi:hypothetical protein